MPNKKTKFNIMKKLKKEDIKQEVFDLYDDYAHNKIERRQFLEKLSLYAVGGITIPSLLSFMMPNYLDSILIKPNDQRLKSEYITHESPNADAATEPVRDRDRSLGPAPVEHDRGGETSRGSRNSRRDGPGPSARSTQASKEGKTHES